MPRAMPTRTTTACLIAVAALAGCGGQTTSTHPTPHAQSSGPLAQPTQILSAAEMALGQVHSFHVTANGVDKDGPISLSADVALPGRMRLTLSQAGRSANIIAVGGATYLKANSKFWSSQHTPPKVTALLADRWIKVPSTAASELQEFGTWTNPATVGRCMLGKRTGTLVLAGRGTAGGRPAQIVEDRGDAPGTAPGRLWVAASTPRLPLRAVQTGPGHPGGTPDRACGETHVTADTTKSSVTTFSRFGAPLTISAPSGALDLQRLTGGGATPASDRQPLPALSG